MTIINCRHTQFISKKRQYHRILVKLNDSDAVMWVNQRIEGAFHEHQIVKLVAFFATRWSPVIIPNVAVVEDAAVFLEGNDEVTGKDDIFRVSRIRGIRQAGSLACEEVADAELAAGVMEVTVHDGDTPAEGVEFGEAGVAGS